MTTICLRCKKPISDRPVTGHTVFCLKCMAIKKKESNSRIYKRIKRPARLKIEICQSVTWQTVRDLGKMLYSHPAMVDEGHALHPMALRLQTQLEALAEKHQELNGMSDHKAIIKQCQEGEVTTP